jgi:hypothetical protein
VTTRAPALVVNFFGGPASGKTTAAARLFVALKLRNADAEMHDEQARQCIQQGQISALEVQPYLFGLQLYKLRTSVKTTDIVIMDSPLLLNPIYDRAESPALRALVLEEHHKFWNLNVAVERPANAPHSMIGRVHDRHESVLLDEKILRFLDVERIPYSVIPRDAEAIERLADEVVAMVTSARRTAEPFLIETPEVHP